jgi:hypothetical protein
MPEKRKYTGETKKSYNRRKGMKGSARKRANKRARKKYGQN